MNGHRAYIGLGANLGERTATLREALRRLTVQPGVKVIGVSSFIETEPVGGPPGQPLYINAAAELDTTLSPRALLELLLDIEQQLGRDRASDQDQRNLPRCIDLDLLLYDDLVQKRPSLEIPHPRMHQREFVLQPLAEIAPEIKHPILNQTACELLAVCHSSVEPAGKHF